MSLDSVARGFVCLIMLHRGAFLSRGGEKHGRQMLSAHDG
jgi:hypothetical protein